MFTIVEDSFVVLFSKGVYRQVKLYEYQGRLYAGLGSGFIALHTRGRTSCPNVRYEEIVTPLKYARTELGRLVVPGIYDGKTLTCC